MGYMGQERRWNKYLGDSNKQMAIDVGEISKLTRYLIYAFLWLPYHTVTWLSLNVSWFPSKDTDSLINSPCILSYCFVHNNFILNKRMNIWVHSVVCWSWVREELIKSCNKYFIEHLLCTRQCPVKMTQQWKMTVLGEI